MSYLIHTLLIQRRPWRLACHRSGAIPQYALPPQYKVLLIAPVAACVTSGLYRLVSNLSFSVAMLAVEGDCWSQDIDGSTVQQQQKYLAEAVARAECAQSVVP